MKHDEPSATKLDGVGAQPPSGDRARHPNLKGPWSDEDERRATEPYVAPHESPARGEKRQGWPAHEQRSPAQSDPRANAAYSERQNTAGERDAQRLTDAPEGQEVFPPARPDADTTDRHKPYIVEAMAPPSVPPVVPSRSDLPFDARTDRASTHEDPGVAPPATEDVPTPHGELPLDTFDRSRR